MNFVKYAPCQKNLEQKLLLLMKFIVQDTYQFLVQ